MKYVIVTTGKLILGENGMKYEIALDVSAAQFLNEKVVTVKNSDGKIIISDLEGKIYFELNGKAINVYRKKNRLFIASNNGCYEISQGKIKVIASEPSVGCSLNYVLIYRVEDDNIQYILYSRDGRKIDYVSYNKKVLFLGESRRYAYILQGDQIKVCNMKNGCSEKYKLPQEFAIGLIRQGRILLSDGYNIWEFNLGSRKFSHLFSLDELVLSFDFIFSK